MSKQPDSWWQRCDLKYDRVMLRTIIKGDYGLGHFEGQAPRLDIAREMGVSAVEAKKPKAKVWKGENYVRPGGQYPLSDGRGGDQEAQIPLLPLQRRRLAWAAEVASGALARVFTEDGVWDGSPIVKAEGRAEIRKLFDHFAEQPMAYHVVTNPIIEIEGDFARAHWHLIGAGRMPDDSSILGMGGYEDEYVRTPEGWRIKLMRVIWGRGTKLPHGWGQDDPNLM